MNSPRSAESTERAPGLVDYWRILKKRWIVALVAWLSVCVTAVLHETNRPRYFSCFIDIAIAPEPIMSRGIFTPADPRSGAENNIPYYVNHVKSEGCIGAVIRTGVLGTVPPQKTPEWLNMFEEISAVTSAEQLGKRRIVRISVAGGDPDYVYSLANAFGASFGPSLVEDMVYSSQRMVKFLDAEIRKTELEIANYRAVIAELERRMGHQGKEENVGISAARITAARRMLRERMMVLNQVSDSLASGQAPSLDDMEMAIIGIHAAIPEDIAQGLEGAALDRMNSSRAVWEDRSKKYREVAKTLTDFHPDKAVAHKQLMEASIDLIQQIGLWGRTVDAQLAEREASIPRGIPVDTTPVAQLFLPMETGTPNPMSLARYRSEVTVRESLLTELTKKRTELQLEQSGRENMAQWVRPAIRPSAPDNPDLSRSFWLGSGIGVMVAFAMVLLVESLDRSIKTPGSAEMLLGRRVIGIIPHFTGGIGNSDVASERLVVETRPNAAEAEAYRALAHKIDVGPQRLLVITSTEPQEGKSTTSSNLSAALAEMGRKVLLVSANLRRPTIHKIFEVAESPGIFEVMNGDMEWKKAACPTRIKNLDILPSGVRGAANVASLLSSPEFAQLLRDTLTQYDFVLVDVPPTAPVSDALNVARIADGVLFVYMVGKAEEAAAASVIRTIEDVGGHIIGIVMNDANAVGQFYGYKYSYYRYEDEGSRF